MSPVLPVTSGIASWPDLSSEHPGHAGHPGHSAMYSGQYMPPGLQQHYGGWGYGTPQNTMGAQPPLLT